MTCRSSGPPLRAEMGYTLADRIMHRIENTDVQAGHQIVAARLVTVK